MSPFDRTLPPRIFVIGYMGSDRRGRAERIAAMDGYIHVDTDTMIENKVQKSIKALCMSMGEHEYRNKEYEALQYLSEEEDIVVSCGDGIVLDDGCREILRQNRVIFVKEDMEVLWERVKNDDTLPYAFLSGRDEALNYQKFLSLYESRKDLYTLCAKKQKARKEKNHDL